MINRNLSGVPWVAFTCLVGLSKAVLSAPTLVVNLGPYSTAEAAAADREKVGWDDGQPADDVICTEAWAAAELQRYLRRMTGRDVPIVDDDQIPPGDLLLLGNLESNAAVLAFAEALDATPEALAALGPEGFRLKMATVEGRTMLWLGGGGRVGTLYAVYGLLERLGVRWFAPGEIHEVVPRFDQGQEPPDATLKSLVRWLLGASEITLPPSHSPTPPLPLDVADRPAFVTRGFWAWENRGNPDFFRWMARNRMNLWTVTQEEHALLKQLGIQMTCGGHLHQDRFLHPRQPYPYNHPQFQGDEDRPTDPYPVSDDYQGDADGNGVLTYSEAHPEWYALRGGRRSFNIQGDGGDNFCTSNADAAAELMKNIVQDLIDGQWQDADSINFWMLDGGRWCECENCQAQGSPTDRNLRMVHRLRQEIEKARAEGRLRRNVRIAFLAYADVIEPPTKPLPEGFDYENCIATFFPIARCYVHAFNDPACTEFNTRYQRHFFGWALDPNRHYRGQIFIGEYYNVSGYRCLPVPFYRTMSVDIPFYYQSGARHMHYMHVTTGNWGTKALTNYQLAKMLWNPELDADALLDEYFRLRYGPAAAEMREFYAHLERALCNVTMLKYDLARRISSDQAEFFPRQHLKYEETHPETDDGPDFTEMLAHIDAARQLLDGVLARDLPPDVRPRVEEDAGPFAYAENTLHFYDAVMQTIWLLRDGQRDAAEARFKQAWKTAQALQRDTVSTSLSSSHASARDGLAASYIVEAYQRLLSEVGPMEEEATV